jgi:sulfate transport system substrate-binding protein
VRRLCLGTALSAIAILVLTSCGGSTNSKKLTLVAYSTPREAYAQIIPAFQKTDAGKGVKFEQSYAASGEQALAVNSGLAADIVALSLEPDVTKIVDTGLIEPGWNKDAYHGMITDSVVVFVVRSGNPKGIKTWDDLLAQGIDVITPNPFTSGGARWNIMAAYGAWRAAGLTHEQSVGKLLELFRNVSVQDKSAREALQTFSSGKGDVMLGYENEAILARQSGEKLDYVVPDATILIENPVAILKDSKATKAAQAFVDFLHSPTAQRIYAKNGYRPVVKSVLDEFSAEYPDVPDLFTIAKYGGWSKVQTQFFDSTDGVMAEVERKVGGSTE